MKKKKRKLKPGDIFEWIWDEPYNFINLVVSVNNDQNISMLCVYVENKLEETELFNFYDHFDMDFDTRDYKIL